MNNPNSFLTRVKEISRQHNVDLVNKLLKSGWCLLAIEQHRDSTDPSLLPTAYILGRMEEVVEAQEEALSHSHNYRRNA